MYKFKLPSKKSNSLQIFPPNKTHIHTTTISTTSPPNHLKPIIRKTNSCYPTYKSDHFHKNYFTNCSPRPTCKNTSSISNLFANTKKTNSTNAYKIRSYKSSYAPQNYKFISRNNNNSSACGGISNNNTIFTRLSFKRLKPCKSFSFSNKKYSTSFRSNNFSRKPHQLHDKTFLEYTSQLNQINNYSNEDLFSNVLPLHYKRQATRSLSHQESINQRRQRYKSIKRTNTITSPKDEMSRKRLTSLTNAKTYTHDVSIDRVLNPAQVVEAENLGSSREKLDEKKPIMYEDVFNLPGSKDRRKIFEIFGHFEGLRSA